MTKYINLTAALSMHKPPKSDRYYQTDNLDDAYEQGWDAALSCLEKLPIAGVAPIMYARWIYHDDGVITCSKCGNAESSDSYYCRYCGAKMDGDNENV